MIPNFDDFFNLYGDRKIVENYYCAVGLSREMGMRSVNTVGFLRTILESTSKSTFKQRRRPTTIEACRECNFL